MLPIWAEPEAPKPALTTWGGAGRGAQGRQGGAPARKAAKFKPGGGDPPLSRLSLSTHPAAQLCPSGEQWERVGVSLAKGQRPQGCEDNYVCPRFLPRFKTPFLLGVSSPLGLSNSASSSLLCGNQMNAVSSTKRQVEPGDRRAPPSKTRFFQGTDSATWVLSSRRAGFVFGVQTRALPKPLIEREGYTGNT